jgi:ribosomal protein L11
MNTKQNKTKYKQSAKKIAVDVAKATMEFKGQKCTAKLIIQNRQAQVEVVPTAASLIIRALKEPERDRKKEKNILHDGGELSCFTRLVLLHLPFFFCRAPPPLSVPFNLSFRFTPLSFDRRVCFCQPPVRDREIARAAEPSCESRRITGQHCCCALHVAHVQALHTAFLIISTDITIEELYEIARVMKPRSMSKEFSGVVKEMLGTGRFDQFASAHDQSFGYNQHCLASRHIDRHLHSLSRALASLLVLFFPFLSYSALGRLHHRRRGAR